MERLDGSEDGVVQLKVPRATEGGQSSRDIRYGANVLEPPQQLEIRHGGMMGPHMDVRLIKGTIRVVVIPDPRRLDKK